MINIAHGNLLKAEVEALVNTVNTQGVMGKGIAAQFKRAYPQAFNQYRRACEAGEVKVGEMHVVDLGAMGGGPRWIINFPTKRHWKSNSKIEDIKSGLIALRRTIADLGISSIAVPPLGCGNGGLAWASVEPLIRAELGAIDNLRVELYSPEGAPAAEEMPNRTAMPPMTAGMAAVVALVDNYRLGLLEPFVQLIEVHKLMYFLQEAGEQLRLKYAKGLYGPYSLNLRHVLDRMEGHYISGYGDGQDDPTKCIDLAEGAEDRAIEFLEGRLDTHARIERVVSLIKGFENPFGMELLGSVHWVMMHEPEAVESVDVATRFVRNWNERKALLMQPAHIAKAWERLKEHRWDQESRSSIH